MQELLNIGFDVLESRQRGLPFTVGSRFAEPDDLPDAVMDSLAGEAVLALLRARCDDGIAGVLGALSNSFSKARFHDRVLEMQVRCCGTASSVPQPADELVEGEATAPVEAAAPAVEPETTPAPVSP